MNASERPLRFLWVVVDSLRRGGVETRANFLKVSRASLVPRRLPGKEGKQSVPRLLLHPVSEALRREIETMTSIKLSGTLDSLPPSKPAKFLHVPSKMQVMSINGEPLDEPVLVKKDDRLFCDPTSNKVWTEPPKRPSWFARLLRRLRLIHPALPADVGHCKE